MTKQKLEKFSRQLKKKHERLRKWAASSGIEAYRVYNRDMGDLPLLIDIYGKYLHIALVEQKGVTPLNDEDILKLIDTAARALYVPSNMIYFKRRGKLEGKEQYVKYSGENVCTTIGEYGLNFKINLSDYLDTGLFLDHRSTRALVREHGKGRRILNLYSYTGSFSVYGAAGGADSTTSVDLSRVYLDWAKENMELNHFTAAAHKYVQSDVFTFLKEAKKEKKVWDMIVLDPPTFSNSRKMDRVLDIQKNHVELIEDCLTLLSGRGILIFSNNYQEFKLDPKVRENGFVNNISEETIPEDFMGSKPHKCWIIEKRR